MHDHVAAVERAAVQSRAHLDSFTAIPRVIAARFQADYCQALHDEYPGTKAETKAELHADWQAARRRWRGWRWPIR